ncbi:MAG: autotransporter outer membrane beta-barrel domain-containing protein [Planctomycetes bacterium]|nr:autotransporter outer membrane beta-barrel domain-containing protein [Planctomycetota bacterium]
MKKAGFAVMVAVSLLMTIGWGNALDDLTYNGRTISEFRAYPPDFANTYAGEPYPDVMGASITIQREFRRTLPSVSSYSQTAPSQYHADSGVSGHAFADVASRDARYAGFPTTICIPGTRWVMWDSPFYMMRDNKKPADGFLGYSTAVAGFATGLTRMLGDSGAIGLAVGYDARRMTPKGKGYHFRNKADTLHLALYGGTTLGNLSFDAYAGWSRSWNRMEREVTWEGDRVGIFKDGYRDNVYSAGIKASYVWVLPNDIRITPSFGLDLSHVHMDAISDTSPDAWESGLRSSETGYSNLAMPILVSVNRTFGSDFWTFDGARSL